MDCLADKIGLRVCGFEGTIYIDDFFPEISLKKAAEVTDQRPKGSDFMINLISVAAMRVAHEFATDMDLFRFGSVLSTKTIGYFTEDCASISGNIEIEPNSCDKYSTVKINTITVKPCQEVQNGVIKIEHECGEDLFEYESDCATTLQIDKTYDSKITISNNAQGEFQQTQSGNCTCARGCDSCSCGCVKVTDPLTTGMQIEAQCVCDREKFICAYADELIYATLYKCAELFAVARITSDRLTHYAVWNLEEAKGALKLYRAKYDQEMERVLLSIRKSLLRENSDCIECTGYQYVLSNP